MGVSLGKRPALGLFIVPLVILRGCTKAPLASPCEKGLISFIFAFWYIEPKQGASVPGHGPRTGDIRQLSGFAQWRCQRN